MIPLPTSCASPARSRRPAERGSNPLALWVRIGVPAALVAGLVLAIVGYRRGPERISPAVGATLNVIALAGYLVLLVSELRGASLAG